MEIFAARLKFIREEKRYTQKELAESIEMTQSSYSKYEYNLREPNLNTLAKISTSLDESADFLIGVTHYDKKSAKLLSNLHYSKKELKDSHHMIDIFLKETNIESDVIKINLERTHHRIKSRNEIISETKNLLSIHCANIPFFPQSLIDELKEE